jgi:hypothetical protein
VVGTFRGDSDVTTVADISKWVEDAELGVAVREVFGGLQVRAITPTGVYNINHAMNAAYGASWIHLKPFKGTWNIGELHRLAFARALSPVRWPEVLGHYPVGYFDQNVPTCELYPHGSAVTP